MGGFSTLGGGVTWEEIKQKLESEGSKNKAYDIDSDGLVENIRFKSVAELPVTPKDYEVVHYHNAVRLYDSNKGKWGLLLYLFGYNEFDNNGGGAWPKYINIPITTSPSEYAQYKVVIDSNNVTVYSADGTQKVQSAVASDFWVNVKSCGSDIRVFDQAKSQLYFWIEEWDYSNQKAVIWVKVEAGSSELNIAYGNPSAMKSSYENGEQVFEAFDDFSETELDTTKWEVEFRGNSYNIQDGILHIDDSDSGEAKSLFYSKNTVDASVIVEMRARGSNSKIGTLAVDKSNDFIRWHWIAKDDYNFLEDSKYSVTTQRIEAHYIGYTTYENEWHYFKTIFNGDYAKGYVRNEQRGTESTVEYTFSRSLGAYQVGFACYYTVMEVDWIRVLKLADPADFGTPQILEF